MTVKEAIVKLLDQPMDAELVMCDGTPVEEIEVVFRDIHEEEVFDVFVVEVR